MSIEISSHFLQHNHLLRKARVQRHWTQSTLAAQLNTTRMTIVRWEQGKTVPSLYFREQLCKTFSLTEQELGLEPQQSEAKRAQIWMVPQERNLFFTGRETTLDLLHTAFYEGEMSAAYQVQTISGLTGMGKTQVALEYAYRFKKNYAVIIWLHAETHETLLTDLIKLAIALQLPAGHGEDETQLVHTLRNWLETSRNWLLILDDVQELTLVSRLLPSHDLKGCVLITTRMQVTGRFSRHLNLEEMGSKEGALLLLRRAKLLAVQQDFTDAHMEQRILATELCEKLGGLPLALDQAGSYIEETGCCLAGYLERIQHRRSALLSWHRQDPGGYPNSVTEALLMAQERVTRRSTIALELLHLCLFLHPGNIPEKLITDGSVHLGSLIQSSVADLLSLDEAFAVLNASALLRRHPETYLLTMHSLVQTVLRDKLEEGVQCLWVERVLNALHHIFPAFSYYEVVAWPFCELLLPHILECVGHAERLVHSKQHMSIATTGSTLLLKVARYLLGRTRYEEAELLLKRALDLSTQISSSTYHAGRTTIFHTLALLYEKLGRYKEAEALVQQIFLIQCEELAENDPQVACSLHILVLLNRKLGKNTEASQLARQALQIYQQSISNDHLELADVFNTLDQLHLWTSRKDFYESVLASSQGEDHSSDDVVLV